MHHLFFNFHLSYTMRMTAFAWWILSSIGCTAQPPLTGRLLLPANNTTAHMIYLVQPRQFSDIAANFLATVVDSALVQPDGHFRFSKMPNCPVPTLFELVLHQKGERFGNRLRDEKPETANYMPFVWKEGDALAVTANADAFQSTFSLQVSSPENAALLQLRTIRQHAFQQQLANASAGAHDESALLDQEAAQLRFQQPLMAFADSCSHLLPVLVAVRWVSPKGDFERVPELLARQCIRWQGKHPLVVGLCQLAAPDKLPVLVGDTLPHFLLPMLAGDTLPLRALLGKQLTLLDLWASWCAPCRRENRTTLVPLWKDFQSKGFQIIGYALDANHTVWKRAIEQDGVGLWPHASHLQGDDAPLLHALRLTTIPTNFLLDAQGRVVAKNLHGDALRTFVANYCQ